MKYLVVCPVSEEAGNEGMYNRLSLRGMAENAYPLYADDGSEGGLGNREVRGWFVTREDSIQLVAEELTKNFPGQSVEVYALQAVHVRQIGKMESKSVDKNGILPQSI